MRIGLITGEYPPMEGGIGAHCRRLAGELVTQGHHVAIFTDQRGSETRPEIAFTNTASRWRCGTLQAIKAWAKQEALHIVNLHFQTAAYRMSPWIHYLPDVLRKTAPVVTTFHDLRFPYLFPKAGRLRDWIVMRLAKASAGVIATNHEDAARLAHLPHHALIPIGSSVEPRLPQPFQRDEWRAKAGATAGDFLLGYFGFINHSKGVDVLLQSMAELVSAGMRLKLVMIGGRTGTSDPSNTAYVQKIDKQIEDLQLSNHLHWTGFLPDEEASAYFAAADLIVLPFRDGASYRRSSLMGVIAHECPILTTQPLVEIPTFENGSNLMMVAPGSRPALSAAIQVLHRSPEIRSQLQKGAQTLKTHFAWDQITAENAAFFQQVVER